jgi:hypothetical protein
MRCPKRIPPCCHVMPLRESEYVIARNEIHEAISERPELIRC